ncbi:phosphate propanoyltransferase [Virgibacillus necropolis]|uniref:Phosphate propanoyltransferase n=1 Tax=Virgibacillus necropolis TaxID=163877 RepID=A0A221M9M8_9BACI|nr:phosphate propanoyltransferase [Virgibacillus necropolis]ASN04345.1 propanediol utilization protein [Virgibacillus necropolis]
MNQQSLDEIVKDVITQLHNNNEGSSSGIPIGVSARHCHLDKIALERLFGEGYELTKKANLGQPGQFASNETVTIVGPKGSIEKVRILGPLRKSSQVEVSQTDAFKLGLKPPIRDSGNLSNSSPITIVGPKGSIFLHEGLIIAQAHIHMSPENAEHYGVQNGEHVRVKVGNERRPIQFEKVLIRVSKKYKLEMHIDTDEANAGIVKTGNYGELLKAGSSYD